MTLEVIFDKILKNKEIENDLLNKFNTEYNEKEDTKIEKFFNEINEKSKILNENNIKTQINLLKLIKNTDLLKYSIIKLINFYDIIKSEHLNNIKQSKLWFLVKYKLTNEEINEIKQKIITNIDSGVLLNKKNRIKLFVDIIKKIDNDYVENERFDKLKSILCPIKQFKRSITGENNCLKKEEIEEIMDEKNPFKVNEEKLIKIIINRNLNTDLFLEVTEITGDNTGDLKDLLEIPGKEGFTKKLDEPDNSGKPIIQIFDSNSYCFLNNFFL